MDKLDKFSEWMSQNSKLSDSSVYKYTRAINTISNDMLERNVINKSLIDMNLVEMDIAVLNILNDQYFLKKNHKGNNMYSNALKQFRYFTIDRTENSDEEIKIVQGISETKVLSETEKMTIIKARIGQGTYREKLLEKYEQKCIVTGIDKSYLLIASHIKPWSICNNDERIDTENGLILCPNMDKLFDCGLISFENNGKMLISSFVGMENTRRLHISKGMIVDLRPTRRLLAYMEYHRDVLFVK